MVYDWEDKRNVCWRMYVDEKKTTKQIMDFFRQELGFVPRYVSFVSLPAMFVVSANVVAVSVEMIKAGA